MPQGRIQGVGTLRRPLVLAGLAGQVGFDSFEVAPDGAVVAVVRIQMRAPADAALAAAVAAQLAAVRAGQRPAPIDYAVNLVEDPDAAL